MLERVASRPVYEVGEDEISVADMVLHVRSLLEAVKKDEPLFILQVMEKQRSRRAMICLFLAVLEMVKTQTLRRFCSRICSARSRSPGANAFEEADAQPPAR